MKRLLLAFGLSALHLGLMAATGGLIYRRGSQKTELFFRLETQRRPEIWTDRYSDPSGETKIIERVFLAVGQPLRYEYEDHQQGGFGIVEIHDRRLKLRWDHAKRHSERWVARPENLTFGPLYVELLKARFDDLLAGGPCRSWAETT